MEYAVLAAVLVAIFAQARWLKGRIDGIETLLREYNDTSLRNTERCSTRLANHYKKIVSLEDWRRSKAERGHRL